MRFLNLSPGYLGLDFSNLTLNSKFYSLLSKKQGGLSNLSDDSIYFPQRIPRTGFFEELEHVETEAFKFGFNKIRGELRVLLSDAEQSLGQEPNSKIFNLINLSARFGLLPEVAKLRESADVTFSTEAKFALDFQLFTYRISFALSNDLTVDTDDIKRLFELYRSSSVSPLLKAQCEARLLVTICRYLNDSKYTHSLEELKSSLLKYLNTYVAETIQERITTSMVWRALPMVRTVSDEDKKAYIKNAIQIAESIPDDGPLKKVLRSELLLTTFQSASKTYLKESFEEGLSFLIRMTELDPYDSTAFSELGLLLYKTGDITRALHNFLQAATLGPPGLALNLYFAGKCYTESHDYESAIVHFKKCIRVDSTAISAWLDLARVLKHVGDDIESGRLRSIILQTPSLMEQITSDELRDLQSL